MTRSVGGSTLWMTSVATDGLPRAAFPPGAQGQPDGEVGMEGMVVEDRHVERLGVNARAKVRVCTVGVKFTPGTAVPPLVVATVTVTGTCESTDRVT